MNKGKRGFDLSNESNDSNEVSTSLKALKLSHLHLSEQTQCMQGNADDRESISNALPTSPR